MTKHDKSRAERHCASMARHRQSKKDRGLVEIRLGWGSDEEKTHLAAVLKFLRDPAKRPLVVNTMVTLGEPEHTGSEAPGPSTGAKDDAMEHVEIKFAQNTAQNYQPNVVQAAQASRLPDVQSNQASSLEATTVLPSKRQVETPASKPKGIFFDTFMS